MNVVMKRTKSAALAALAPLLQYPQEDYLARAEECKAMVDLFYPDAVPGMAEFQTALSTKSLSELEEIYTRTFDMAPLCTPYVTTYLYGEENLERGALMTKLAERYAQGHFDLNGELPDHIAVILAFCPQFDETELSEIIEYCLAAPLQKMCESLKDAESIYHPLLRAVLAILSCEPTEDCAR